MCACIAKTCGPRSGTMFHHRRLAPAASPGWWVLGNAPRIAPTEPGIQRKSKIPALSPPRELAQWRSGGGRQRRRRQRAPHDAAGSIACASARWARNRMRSRMPNCGRGTQMSQASRQSKSLSRLSRSVLSHHICLVCYICQGKTHGSHTRFDMKPRKRQGAAEAGRSQGTVQGKAPEAQNLVKIRLSWVPPRRTCGPSLGRSPIAMWPRTAPALRPPQLTRQTHARAAPRDSACRCPRNTAAPAPAPEARSSRRR